METPNTKAGNVTERIMRIFWGDMGVHNLETEEYNKVWEHVLFVLTENYPEKKKLP